MSIGDLFGGKEAKQDKITPQTPAQPETASDLLAEVKSKETPQAPVKALPQRREIKFKTAQGREVEVVYIAQGDEPILPALKEIAEAIIAGDLLAEATTAPKAEKDTDMGKSRGADPSKGIGV